MKRRTFLGGAMAVAVVGQGSRALAQQPPIKIGMSMPQTGGLAGGGKASLLGIEIWRDDVNAKGGLLGRKVELVVYDDKSSASESPAIYSKLLDVDKVDLLFAPYGTVPTAPLMPMVKQRGLLLIGNFSFQVNSKVGHDMWFNNAPWGPADSWATSYLAIGQKAGGKTIALLAADQEFAQNLAKTAREVATKLNMQVVFDQAYPPTTVEFSGIIRALKAAKPDIVYVAYYLAPYGYTSGQLIEQAIKAVGSLDQKALAKYLRENTHKTIVGPITYSADGEWKETGVVQAQFRGVVDKNIEQFRASGKQVI